MLAFWVFLLLQLMLTLTVAEPFPSFSMPRFGLSREKAEPNTPKDIPQLLAISDNDTVNLLENGPLAKLSPVAQTALIRKIIKRHHTALDRNSLEPLRKWRWQNYLAPRETELSELGRWIYEMYKVKPNQLVVGLTATANTQGSQGAKSPESWINIELPE